MEVLSWIAGLALFGAILPLLFLPSILAYRRKHRRANTILLVNLLLGPVGIGWIVGMALLYSPEQGKALTPPTGDDVLLCPSCGFGYVLTDYRADTIEIHCSRCVALLPRGSAS